MDDDDNSTVQFGCAYLFIIMFFCGLACADPVREIDLPQTKWNILTDKKIKARLGHQILYRGGILFPGFNSIEDDFGELSALYVNTEGNELLVISDRDGQWLKADIQYTETGNLDAIHYRSHGQLVNEWNEPLTDVEAITRYDDQYLLSFDDRGFILSYDMQFRHPRIFGMLPDFVIQKNGGIEAIAYVPDVGLVCIAEKQLVPVHWFSDKVLAEQQVPRNQTRAMWIFSEDGKIRSLLAYHTDNFHPSDAIVLPSGNLLVIHRPDFSGKNRLRLVCVLKETLLTAKIMVHGQTVLELSEQDKNHVLDNFEGLASFSRDNRDFVFLLSDDNLNPVQKTLLLLFELNLQGEYR